MAWIAAIVGRICLAALFVFSGIPKVSAPAMTAQYMASAGLPGSFALPVGVFEIVAGLLLAIGFMTRLTALVLAAFTVVATVLFHSQVTDPMQATQALKNLAVIGGLLMVFAYGQVSWRLDTWRERNKRHDAEVAAARAEARAEALEHNRTVVVDRTAPATEHPVVTDRVAPAAPERRGFMNWRRTMANRTDGDPRT